MPLLAPLLALGTPPAAIKLSGEGSRIVFGTGGMPTAEATLTASCTQPEPAVSYLWPTVFSASEVKSGLDISVALKNVASNCINADLATTPCAAHRAAVPPMFYCVFKSGGKSIASNATHALAMEVSTASGRYVGMEVVVKCVVPSMAAISEMIPSFDPAGDTAASFSLGVH